MAKGMTGFHHIKTILDEDSKVCDYCRESAYLTMGRDVKNKWICNVCWEKILKEFLDREVLEILIEKGFFNPSRR